VNATYMQQLIDIAHRAGAAIMEVYRSGDAGETSKADNSPLTLADLAAHRTIVEALTRLTPEIPILSEEAADILYPVRSQWTRYWLVDPLDGTKSFVHGVPIYGVLIALEQGGEVTHGVVHLPALAETVSAGDVFTVSFDSLGSLNQRFI